MKTKNTIPNDALIKMARKIEQDTKQLLKPCPFCGSPAKRISHKLPRKLLKWIPGKNKGKYAKKYVKLMHGVQCSNYKNKDCRAIIDNYASADDARCAWNRREGIT